MSKTTTNEPRSPLLYGDDLPGPMSLHRLAGLGAVRQLDDDSAYLTEDAETLFGRASILAALKPYNTVACAVSAAWVWLGGTFPNTIDVISASHFRAPVHGRRVRVFNRKAPDAHIAAIGRLKTTTPARTACDLALLPPDETPRREVNDMVCALMDSKQCTPQECLAILDENRYWPNAPRARAFFEYIAPCF